MNCFVLAALKRFGGAASPVTALFTGDEEIGSPFSRPVIEQHARGARAVFNSEPGRGKGAAVTGRKGGVFMRFEITGKAAHSGANFDVGISAINELAHKTLALHALTDIAEGHHAQRRRGVRRADRQHGRALGALRGRSALHHACRSHGDHGEGRGDHGQELRAGHDAEARDHRRVPAAGRERRRQERCSSTMPRACASSASSRRRCSPAAAPIPALRRRPARRPSARSVRSAAAPIRRRSTWRSTRWCRAPRRWRSRSCGCADRRKPGIR